MAQHKYSYICTYILLHQQLQSNVIVAAVVIFVLKIWQFNE